MSKSSYNPFPAMPANVPSQRPIPALTPSGKVNLETADPADVHAQNYRQLLAPHPRTLEPLRPPPPPPPSTKLTATCEKDTARPGRAHQMGPLAEIGRRTSPSPKRQARNASNASKNSRQSLPKIEEVPDLDSDNDSISSRDLSRSSSNGSDIKYPTSCSSNMPAHCTSEVADENMKIDRRKAAIWASMARTAWMTEEQSAKGSKSRDLMKHINDVMSAWQRER